MPIPKEILTVPRPKNSIVIAYGKNKDRYAVRTRVGCRRVNGGNRPVNGPTIGHIVEGKYVPLEDKAEPQNVSAASSIDIKDWAGIVLCGMVFNDILGELEKVYSHDDALKIYAIAILRVCNPGIKDYELKEAYENSFLSETYPGVALSRNTVSKFLNNLGKAYSRIVKFMRNRASAVKADHHLLIDGTLKTDNSVVDTLSNFSRKARVKGSRDISVMYAFDLEAMEPVCSQCFPGNMLDLTAYADFLKQNQVTKGLIVSDKGIPASAAEEYFGHNPDLHYLNPLRRNSALIETHDMLSFDAILPTDSNITCKKAKVNGKEKWLYSFRDATKAAKEEQDWLARAKSNDNFSMEELKTRQKTFGTVVFECDLDTTCEIIYAAYSKRWEIEIVMRFYKPACEFDETRVHDDYSVYATEFIDFLSTLLTFRLIKAFDKVKLLEKMTYKKVMAILRHAKKAKTESTDWQLVRCNPSHIEIMQKLTLLPMPQAETKRKCGRPKKSKI